MDTGKQELIKALTKSTLDTLAAHCRKTAAESCREPYLACPRRVADIRFSEPENGEVLAAVFCEDRLLQAERVKSDESTSHMDRETGLYLIELLPTHPGGSARLLWLT